MKNVLIIGSTGQIGSELTMKLRSIYTNGNIVAGYITGAEPKGELKDSGPSALVDITNPQQIAEAVEKYHIDTIYNLAALLSAVAEAKPQLAWKIGVGGLFNVLEVSREKGCAVFTPSSIGSFGPDTPKDKTPQDTVRNPQTMYGVTKYARGTCTDASLIQVKQEYAGTETRRTSSSSFFRTHVLSVSAPALYLFLLCKSSCHAQKPLPVRESSY